jgi:hypothetical protein
LRFSAKQASELSAAGSLANKIWHALCRCAGDGKNVVRLAQRRSDSTISHMGMAAADFLLAIDWQVAQLKTEFYSQ